MLFLKHFVSVGLLPLKTYHNLPEKVTLVELENITAGIWSNCLVLQVRESEAWKERNMPVVKTAGSQQSQNRLPRFPTPNYPGLITEFPHTSKLLHLVILKNSSSSNSSVRPSILPSFDRQLSRTSSFTWKGKEGVNQLGEESGPRPG